jgi:hypothetical protein
MGVRAPLESWERRRNRQEARTVPALPFEEGGTIVVLETATGAVVKKLQETPKKWWWAGVRTQVP